MAADESILLLDTNILVDGKQFIDLQKEIIIIINDEVSLSFEPETLIPTTVTRRRTRFGHLHYVVVGNYKQRSPLSKD